MPGNILSADTGFPDLDRYNSTGDKLTAIENYLKMLLEQLRYTLANLDEGNFNEAGLSGIADMITDPIIARMQDENDNIMQLIVGPDGIGAQLSDAKGNISSLQSTASALQSRISNAEGSISSLTQTAASLDSRISDLDGAVSEISQTVNGITLSVSNGEKSSTITLLANGTEISSQTISFEGNVVFESELADGTTEINGGCIRTGTIAADYIDLYGLMSVGEEQNGAVGGYVGWTTSSIDGSTAMMICDSDQSYGVVCSNSGVKMAGEGGEVVVAASKITVNPGSGDYEFYSNRFASLNGASLGTSNYPWGSVYCDDVYVAQLGGWLSALVK